MNRKRIWAASLTALVAIIGSLIGIVYWYGNQSSIPEGVYLYDWYVGGMQPEQLQQEWGKRNQEWKDKTFTFTVEAPTGSKEYTLSLDQLPVQTNEDQVLQEILAFSKEPSLFNRAWSRWNAQEVHYQLEWKWNEEKLTEMFEKEWADLFQAKPQDAKRIITEQDEVVYEPDQSVFQPDIPQIIQKVKQWTGEQLWKEKMFKVNVPMKEVKAAVTVQILKEEGIERKIAEYTTSYSRSATGRAYNVEMTAESLNDTLLKPDEVFSYRDIIQETEKNFGYKPAPVIMEGELRPGIGGGVCQVSTTLYNAVLLSDLGIVERRNHSLPIAYAPLGRDATFSDWGINFRFKNTTGKNLLIRTAVKNGKLTVKMFGTSPENKEVEIFTKTLKTISPPTKTKTAPELGAGQSKVLNKGKPGYEVAVYKRIKQNGEVMEEKLISTDTYLPQPRVVAVGN